MMGGLSGYQMGGRALIVGPYSALGTHRNKTFVGIIVLFNSLAPWARV